MPRPVKWSFVFVCLAILLCLLFFYFDIQRSKKPLIPSEPVFSAPLKNLQVGERAVYSLQWLGIEVGRSTALVKEMTEIQGRRAFDIVITNWSAPFLDLVFKVRDEYHSYLDAEDFKTLRFTKKVEEGSYRAHEEIDFDHETATARYHSYLNHGRKVFFFERGSVDGVSAVYRYRFLKLDPQTEVRIPVNWDEQQHDLRIPIVKTELTGKSIFGPIESFKVRPYIYKTKDPNIKSSRIEIWVAKDKARIPLRMRARVPIAGSVNAFLVDYSEGAK